MKTRVESPKRSKLTRRAMLKGIGAIGLGAWFANVFIKDGPLDFYDDFFTGITNVNAKEFDNYSWLEECKHKGRLWIMVHKGFIENEGVLKHLNWDYDPSTYNTYLKNTEQLLSRLKLSGEPTLIAVENHLYTEARGEKDASEVCTALLVTSGGVGNLKRFVRTELGTFEQSLPKLKNALKKSGVHTVCLAGELTYHPALGGSGCVEGMAMNFADEFDIRGVKNCLYPITPPRNPWPLQKELYFDQVVAP